MVSVDTKEGLKEDTGNDKRCKSFCGEISERLNSIDEWEGRLTGYSEVLVVLPLGEIGESGSRGWFGGREWRIPFSSIS